MHQNNVLQHKMKKSCYMQNFTQQLLYGLYCFTLAFFPSYTITLSFLMIRNLHDLVFTLFKETCWQSIHRVRRNRYSSSSNNNINRHCLSRLWFKEFNKYLFEIKCCYSWFPYYRSMQNYEIFYLYQIVFKR